MSVPRSGRRCIPPPKHVVESMIKEIAMKVLFGISILALMALPVAAKGQEGQPGSATSQQVIAPSPAQIQAIDRVRHWVGDWAGSGWSMSPDRQRHDFEIVERVELRLGGSVLLIEGRGVMEPEAGVRTTSHESLAILSFDVETNRYNWRTYDLRGSVRDPDFIVEPDSFRWSFRDEESGVLLRFKIVIQGDSWHETGEVSPDEGENWYRILEMNLTRQ
jgi:hypothetical protein